MSDEGFELPFMREQLSMEIQFFGILTQIGNGLEMLGFREIEVLEELVTEGRCRDSHRWQYPFHDRQYIPIFRP